MIDQHILDHVHTRVSTANTYSVTDCAICRKMIQTRGNLEVWVGAGERHPHIIVCLDHLQCAVAVAAQDLLQAFE